MSVMVDLSADLKCWLLFRNHTCQSLTGEKKVFLGEAYLRSYLSLKQYDKVAPLSNRF